MAGDWIKVEKATARKPEVLHLSTLLDIHPDHAFGLCFRFWSWCDDQLASCHAAGVTFVTLDSVIGHAGFASALVKVGWLQVREGSLVIPNFERHLSESAKNRALSGKRQKKRRDCVTETSRSDRDKSVTREEKRREEIKDREIKSDEPKNPHEGDDRFQDVWTRWKRHLLERNKPLTPTTEESQLCSLFGYSSEEATAVVEFSILNGAVNLILNGNHRGPPTGGVPTKRQRRVPSFEEGLLRD